MHPAIIHRHSHVCILDPSSVDVDHGFLYDMAPGENGAVEVRFRSDRPLGCAAYINKGQVPKVCISVSEVPFMKYTR